MATLIPIERIEKKIIVIRNQKVMLDKDLAFLYEVETRVLNQAIKRNKERFPEDFMFQLNEQEFTKWKSQIVISIKERMGLRKKPYAFTEQGVAMLSSVLNSERAINVNIEIMRTFTKLREFSITHKELRAKIYEMENKYDKKFRIIFDAINRLLKPPKVKKREIGFRIEKK